MVKDLTGYSQREKDVGASALVAGRCRDAELAQDGIADAGVVLGKVANGADAIDAM